MLTAFEELQKLLKEANEGTLTVQYYFLDTVQYFKVGNILWKVKEIVLIQLITLNIDDLSHHFQVFRPIVFSYLWLKCYYMYIGRLELDSRLQEQENSHAEKTKDYGECLSICQILPSESLRPIPLYLTRRHWGIIDDHILTFHMYKNVISGPIILFLQRRGWVNWRESWRMQMTY